MAVSILPKLKKGLTKTRKALNTPLSELFSSRDKPSPEELNELEELLLSADVSYQIVESIRSQMENLPKEEYRNVGGAKTILRKILLQHISNYSPSNEEEDRHPMIIMFVGVNGSGKTTTVGKLASHLRAQGKSVILAAADTFRDAAIEQLQVWGDRSGFRVIKHRKGSDASAVAFDAVKAAVAGEIDYLLIDTAGRLHTKHNLMKEIEKMQRVIQKDVPEAPHKIYLVLDANTGQNGIAQAEEFLKMVNVTGLILAKMDGTSRAGFIFGVKEKTGLNVEYLGIGEQAEDLVPFHSADFVDALLSE